MARSPEGWTLHTDERHGTIYVRFRHRGHRYNLTTRTRDPVEAAARAPLIYADVIAGRRRLAMPTPAAPRQSLEVLFAEWVASLEGTLDKTTCSQYELYAFTHWLPHFRALGAVSTPMCAEYNRVRLRKVRRRTLLKELSALRGFLDWCVEQGHLLEDQLPRVVSPKQNVTGTPDTRRRHKARAVELAPAEVERILAELPERGGRKGSRPRAFFTVMYETTLRRASLAELHAPTDYRAGAAVLRIRDEADKSRFGRELPLTSRAREALDAVCPEVGRLFPSTRLERQLKAAAVRAGVDAERAERISNHDLRHARTTHLLERTQNLEGVAYMAGHKAITTTNRYAHPSKRAAEEVLADVARVAAARIGSSSGRARKTRGRGKAPK